MQAASDDDHATNLQDATRRDEDATADDGADNDGDTVEESHLGLQFHHIVAPALRTRDNLAAMIWLAEADNVKSCPEQSIR